MTDRPNILLITTDQQSATMLSCAGNRWLNTPAMDSLAARGTRFDRCYVGVPVCMPSRFCMDTGRLASEIGVRGIRCDGADQRPSEEMLDQGLGWLLQRAGYEAYYAGKQHYPNFKAADIGYERIETDQRDGLAATCERFFAEPRGDTPFALMAHFINPHDICYMAIRDACTTEQDRQILKCGQTELAELDRALARPDGVSEQAFFDERCPPLPDNFAPQADEPQAFQALLNERPFKKHVRETWSARRWREHRGAYARLTERVDAQIGRALDALANSDHADNTLVILTSDHGDMDSAHGFEHKTHFYDQAARVPFIMVGPGVRAGQVDDQHVMSNGLDLLPTICDYAGATVPEDLWGSSVRPLLEGGSSWRDYTPMVNQIGHAVVSRTHKYCVFDHGQNAEQLYDLIHDPGETRNALNGLDQADALAQHRAWYSEYW